MDSIVKKLSEIESAASAIIANADKQKEQLDYEYRDKRQSFDTALEEKTMAKINKIRADLDTQTQQLLQEQAGSNTNSIDALKKEYEEHHTDYAKQILKKITEV